MFLFFEWMRIFVKCVCVCVYVCVCTYVVRFVTVSMWECACVWESAMLVRALTTGLKYHPVQHGSYCYNWTVCKYIYSWLSVFIKCAHSYAALLTTEYFVHTQFVSSCGQALQHVLRLTCLHILTLLCSSFHGVRTRQCSRWDARIDQIRVVHLSSSYSWQTLVRVWIPSIIYNQHCHDWYTPKHRHIKRLDKTWYQSVVF